jgi:hypothetical protein
MYAIPYHEQIQQLSLSDRLREMQNEQHDVIKGLCIETDDIFVRLAGLKDFQQVTEKVTVSELKANIPERSDDFVWQAVRIIPVSL